MTSVKELKAEVKTVKNLSASKEVMALCDVLLDIINALEEKGAMGFRSDK